MTMSSTATKRRKTGTKAKSAGKKSAGFDKALAEGKRDHAEALARLSKL